MRHSLYAQLRATARRESRDAGGEEDLVQEALLAAVLAGRMDFDSADTARWLTGTVRNRARMAARGAVRRKTRETRWQAEVHAGAPAAEPGDIAAFLAGLPPALKAVAALTLSGHTRREIAFLLGLNLDLAYGRIRDALLPQLLRHGGMFASHDPDGHLFVIRRSQNPAWRQQAAQTTMEGSP